MRIHLAASLALMLGFSPVYGQQAYHAGMGSIDRALVEAPSAVQQGMPQASSAPMQAAEKQERSFFRRIVPSWITGGEEQAAEQPVDPFMAAQQAIQQPRTGSAPMSSQMRGGVQQVAYQAGAQRQSTQRQPNQRQAGIATRKPTQPTGLFGSLFGSKPQQPAAERQAAQRQAVQQRAAAQRSIAASPNAQRLLPAQPHPMRQPTGMPLPMNSQAAQRVQQPSAQQPSMQQPSMSEVIASDSHKPSSAQQAMMATINNPFAMAKPSSDQPEPSLDPAEIKQLEADFAISAPAMDAAENESEAKQVIVTAEADKPALSKPTLSKPTLSEPTSEAVFASDTQPATHKLPSEPSEVLFVTDDEPTPPTPIAMAETAIESQTDAHSVALGPASLKAPTATEKDVQEPFPVAQAAPIEPATEPSPLYAAPSDRSRTLLGEAHQLASHAKSAEQFDAIIQRCRYVLAIDPSQQAINYANDLGAWALNKRGELLLDSGKPTEAAADFEEALACDADCWRAVHNLGVVRAQTGEYVEADELFRRTLELNPEFAKAYTNRAALRIQEGDFQAALSDYERAIAADPDLAAAHSGCGRLCHLLGDVERAVRHLDAAAVLAPEDATIALGHADLLVDLGRYGQALRSYKQAIDLDPTLANAHRNLAWMLATCPSQEYRNGQAALASVRKAVQLSGVEDDIALDTQAAALASLGRFDKAAALMRKAISIAPEGASEAYVERLGLYQSGQAFLSQPIGSVRTVSHAGETTTR